MWLCLYKFGMLKSLQPTSFLLTTTMCPILYAQCSTIISLLHEHYSVHEIQSKTGIGKSTIGRIKKQVDTNKENNKGGQPFKLSPYDKQFILYQITTGKLDNAVQVANFINSILPNPVSAQKVRNVLKENGLSRRSALFLRGSIKRIVSNFPSTMKTGQ